VSVLIPLLLAATVPPKAYIDTGKAHVPLAISSWCWGLRCGAPLGHPTKVARLTKGTTVRVELAFVPRIAQVAVLGTPQKVTVRDREISWRAAKPGGVTVRVTSSKGWVVYVGRIALNT
jgi:hypothetical protein